jgi:integrase
VGDHFPVNPPQGFLHRLRSLTEDYRYTTLLWAGLKETTRKAYASATRSYEDFCRLQSIKAWPATSQGLASWIVERAWGNTTPGMGQVSGKTLRTYVSALRSIHVDLDLPTLVFESPHVQRLLDGAIRLFPAKPKRKRLALTRDILLKALTPEASRNETQSDRLNANAAFSMAFAGFMRIGEFTHKQSDLDDLNRFTIEKLTRRCVTQSEGGDHYILFLPRSKTDHDNSGVHIVVATASDAACPHYHMMALINGDKREPYDPLFNLSTGAFTREKALSILNKRLARVGIDPQEYSGHSFRKGAAQEAYNNHMSEEQIQALGRWSSDVVRRYFKRNPMRLFALQKQFQTGRTLPLLTRPLS